MVGSDIPCTNGSFWSWWRRWGLLIEVHSIDLVVFEVLDDGRQVIKTPLVKHTAVVRKDVNIMVEHSSPVAA